MIHEDNPSDSLSGPTIDLRSDTVTRPTAEMYERMRVSEVGDDGLDGDPTVQELESLAATTLGKEAGLFVPSATMANLIAVLAQTQRSDQIVLESTSHMNVAERGSATLTGVFYEGVPGVAGAMVLERLTEALDSRFSRLRTSLVCMETPHNNAGGTVLPIAHMRAVHDLARRHEAQVHLDGARLFNAAIALGETPETVARYSDTVTLCLSKGLSAPVGALLVGPASTIRRARGVRKILGGQQRQAGVVAAAGIEAIQVMSSRLQEDHQRARRLAKGIDTIRATFSTQTPQTNIVQVDVARTGWDSVRWVEALKVQGVLVRSSGSMTIRCVTHRHISDADVDGTIDAFRTIANQMNTQHLR